MEQASRQVRATGGYKLAGAPYLPYHHNQTSMAIMQAVALGTIGTHTVTCHISDIPSLRLCLLISNFVL